jgi:K(+)-stimulated pyrophosphate-energized sodium pump
MLAAGVAVAFLLGVAASYVAGYVGMGMAVTGNQRTANQARTTFKGALETAFQAGAVSGMMTVGLGLLGACLIFLVFLNEAMLVLVGFGFGGSLAALWWRRASRRTTRATRPPSPTTWATTWATVPVWRPTSSRATR